MSLRDEQGATDAQAISLSRSLSPALAAERALAGAALFNPHLVSQVPWLRALDFDDLTCRAVWRDLVDHPRAQWEPGTDTAARIQAEQGIHPLHVAPSVLMKLVSDAPVPPAAVDYARMVLEASARRQVVDLGVMVGEAVLQGPRATIAAAATSIAVTTAAEQRLEVATGTRRQVDPDLVDTTDTLSTAAAMERRRAAAKAVAQTLEATGGSLDRDSAERAVLGGLLYGAPDERGMALGRFRAGDVTGPRQATWQAAAALLEQGRPVDEITVQWEQARRLRDHGPGLGLDELRGLRPWAIHVRAGVEVLAQYSTHHVATRVGESVAAAAGNLTMDTAAVLDHAQTGQVAVAAAAIRTAGMTMDGSLQRLREQLLVLGRRDEHTHNRLVEGRRVDELSTRREARRTGGLDRGLGPRA